MDSSSAEEAAAAAVAAVAAAAAAAAAASSSSSAQSMHPHPRVIVDHLHAESARPTMDPVKIRDAFQKALWDYHMDLVERAPVNTASTGIRIDEKARKEKSKRKGGGGDAEEDGMGDEDDDAVAGEDDVVERFELCFKPGPGQLPLARVKRVMKCDDEVKMISAEAPILFARACEIFIADLTSRAYLLAGEHKRRTIHRSDIAGAIGRSDLFDFLVDVVPRDEAQAGGRGPAGRKVRKERSGRAEAAEDAAQQAALNGAHGAEGNGGGAQEERGEEQRDEQEEGVGDDEHSA